MTLSIVFIEFARRIRKRRDRKCGGSEVVLALQGTIISGRAMR